MTTDPIIMNGTHDINYIVKKIDVIIKNFIKSDIHAKVGGRSKN